MLNSSVIFIDLIITNPPQNVMVCVGDDVNITCGYTFSIPLAPVWIIDGQTFSVVDIMNSNLFNSPAVANTTDTVLTVYNVSELTNGTTFQCQFTLSISLKSSISTLTIFGNVCVA